MRNMLALLVLTAWMAPAYQPAVDKAGPLTVEIHEPAIGSYGAGGPVMLNRTEAPFQLTVSIRNSGDTPVRGTLRVARTICTTVGAAIRGWSYLRWNRGGLSHEQTSGGGAT